jgi:hypothetical protein
MKEKWVDREQLPGQDWGSPHPPYVSRLNDILKWIHSLDYHYKRQFTCIDLCCGLGEVILGISKEFPQALCIGVDVVDYDIRVTGEYIFIEKRFQEFIKEVSHVNFVIMLETYRNWKPLATFKDEFDQWLEKHADIFIYSGEIPQHWGSYEKVGNDNGNEIRAIKLRRDT